MEAMLKKLLAVSAAALLTFATGALALQMRADHPDTYVVVKGDTLWGIAKRFLNEPWLWPEIWQANPQIENPHLIYPGDVLSLAYLGRGRGQPALTVSRLSPQVRAEALPIPAVPLSEVQDFLTNQHVLDEDQYKALPYVLGIEESRLMSAEGQVVYVRGQNLEPGARVSIVRPTVRYAMMPIATEKHPDREPVLRNDAWSAERGAEPTSNSIRWAHHYITKKRFEVLGWEVNEIAQGQVTRSGDPATVLIVPGGHEVKKGDLLMPFDAFPYDLSFHPRAPAGIPANARVLAVTDHLHFGGRNDVVAISAGAREGLENGQVFSIWHQGERVRDDIRHPQRVEANLNRNKVSLPDEFAGHVMIFRTFDKVSYGLVMDGIRPVQLGDRLDAPDRY